MNAATWRPGRGWSRTTNGRRLHCSFASSGTPGAAPPEQLPRCLTLSVPLNVGLAGLAHMRVLGGALPAAPCSFRQHASVSSRVAARQRRVVHRQGAVALFTGASAPGFVAARPR